MAARSPAYLAAPPSLGLRPLRAEPGDVRPSFVAADLGGRGVAMRALAVRVERDDDRYRRSGPEPTGSDWPEGSLVPTLVRVDGTELAGGVVYRLALDGAALAGAADWLLLLIYRQRDDRGTADAAPADAAGLQELRAAVVRATLDAVDVLLQATPAADLQRFRVRPSLPREPASPQAAALRFVFSSCQYPSGIVDGTTGRDIGLPDIARDPVRSAGGAWQPSHMLRPGPADASYHRLAGRLDAGLAAEFLLLVGDQVYVDETAGLFDPAPADSGHFRVPYEIWLGSPCVQEVLYRLPLECTIDDHEIVDNWEPESAKVQAGARPEWLQLRERGVGAFQRFQRGVDSDPQARLWRTFCSADGLPFFLMDTRSQREHRDARTLRQARLVSELQFEALHEWLVDHRETPKFIASPSILLPRQTTTLEHPASALRSDAWDGYPATLHRLLALLVDEQVRHCVFLSGDEHLACLARIELQNVDETAPPLLVHSVHSSALYAPYPFANAVPEDLAACERFRFSPENGRGRVYTAGVETWFPRFGTGFTRVRLDRAPSGWTLELVFDGSEGCESKTIALSD